MKILVDYLTFSSKSLQISDLKELLNLYEVEYVAGKGRNGWLNCEYSNGIRLFWGGREDVGVEMSGSGCRFLETCNNNNFDWLKLFDYFIDMEDDINVSRLDIACDDKDAVLSMASIMDCVKARHYISRARRCVWTGGDEEQVIFGAPSSDTRLRIYNKALERGVDEKWIRAEFQLRNEAADSFIQNYCQHRDIGYVYSGVLNNYIRFVDGNPEDVNEHYDMLQVLDWWQAFLGGSHKIKNVSVVGAEYNLQTLYDYIKAQVAPSLKAFVRASGGDLTPLLEIISEARLSKKQLQLINKEAPESNSEAYNEVKL